MVEPLRPEDVTKAKTKQFPDVVIKIWNDAIAANWSPNSSVIKQDDMVSKISGALDISRQQCFDKGYLDIEDTYEAQGWKVDYDKPGYCENYPATFTFTKKRK